MSFCLDIRHDSIKVNINQTLNFWQRNFIYNQSTFVVGIYSTPLMPCYYGSIAIAKLFLQRKIPMTAEDLLLTCSLDMRQKRIVTGPLSQAIRKIEDVILQNTSVSCGWDRLWWNNWLDYILSMSVEDIIKLIHSYMKNLSCSLIWNKDVIWV